MIEMKKKNLWYYILEKKVEKLNTNKYGHSS